MRTSVFGDDFIVTEFNNLEYNEDCVGLDINQKM